MLGVTSGAYTPMVTRLSDCGGTSTRETMILAPSLTLDSIPQCHDRTRSRLQLITLRTLMK